MVITFSRGKLIVSPFEVQIRLQDCQAVLRAMVEDIQVRRDVLVLSADAGAVQWSLTLDNEAQIDSLVAIVGEQVLS